MKKYENEQAFQQLVNDYYTPFQGKYVVGAKVEKTTKRRPGGGITKCNIRLKGREMHSKNGRPQGMHKRRKAITRKKKEDKR